MWCCWIKPWVNSARCGSLILIAIRKKPCVYVGMTGLAPEERFTNHKQGIKSSSLVKRYGLRLLPELYAHLNPMPYDAAVQMEKDLTEDLRRAGYTVVGGH